MEFITGGLFVLVTVLCYDKFKPKSKAVVNATDVREDEYQKRYEEHFDALFNYTPDKAYRKVK